MRKRSTEPLLEAYGSIAHRVPFFGIAEAEDLIVKGVPDLVLVAVLDLKPVVEV